MIAVVAQHNLLEPCIDRNNPPFSFRSQNPNPIRHPGGGLVKDLFKRSGWQVHSTQQAGPVTKAARIFHLCSKGKTAIFSSSNLDGLKFSEDLSNLCKGLGPFPPSPCFISRLPLAASNSSRRPFCMHEILFYFCSPSYEKKTTFLLGACAPQHFNASCAHQHLASFGLT